MVAAAAAFLGVPRSEASVLRERLQDVVAATPVVVLAEVTSVEGLPQRDWKATARVNEVWKGPERASASYGPAGYCDTAGCEGSAAVIGEKVVLFLEQDRNRISDVLRIRCFGYGRLPVYTVDGKMLVDSSAFFLPSSITPTRAVVGGYTRQLLPLAWLRDFVKASASETSKVDH